MHIQSVDQVKAIKTVKRKITDLDRSKIEEQKKAVRKNKIISRFYNRDVGIRFWKKYFRKESRMD